MGDHWSGLERTKLIGRISAVLATALAILPSLSGGVYGFGEGGLIPALQDVATSFAMIVGAIVFAAVAVLFAIGPVDDSIMD